MMRTRPNFQFSPPSFERAQKDRTVPLLLLSHITMTKNGNGAFLGIDLGTQGLTTLLVDENLDVLATGEASYECIPGPPGHYEQKPSDWERALQLALEEIEPISSVRTILGIGISGQMHGHCLVNKENQLTCDTARLWCDARNEEEAQELSNVFQSKIPKRSTIARWLWTIRNRDSNLVENVDYLTTPAGWLHLKLTGRRVLGTFQSRTLSLPPTLTLTSFEQLFNKELGKPLACFQLMR